MGVEVRAPVRDREAVSVVEGPDAGSLRRALDLSRRDFSRLTGFSERAIAGWESGERPSGLSDLPFHIIFPLICALSSATAGLGQAALKGILVTGPAISKCGEAVAESEVL